MTRKMILPFGDPLLRKKSKPVTEFNSKLHKLLDDMAETLYAADGQAGLAAPQVGILRRVIVLDCGDGLIELINPEIMGAKDEQPGSEACLSLPGYNGVVKRATYVKIRFQDRNGLVTELAGEGFLARCFQHEIDHLNGILYIDHIKNGDFYLDETERKVNLMQAVALSKPI
ncbi:MAG: peptide deformylase [Gorillibacterium sp.]|nr:peptide deformylase [Gorillibacterium sp.]